MLQLKPGLRRPTLRRGPKATLYDLKFFYQIGDPYRLQKANKFPFREAIPLYMSSQVEKTKPKVHQFLLHNLNKKMNRYYNTGEIGSTSLMKKYKEAWKIMGLRDIIKGFEREDEIYSLKNYWLFKLYPYYDRKFIEEFSKKCPRLKEFVKKRRKGDTGRLQFFKRYMSTWKSPQNETAKEKWLLKRFQKELDFSRKQTKYLNVYLETFMGSKRYKEEKMDKMHRAITILNMFYNVFGTEIDKELKGKLEKDKKLSKLNDETKREKVLTLVIRAKPKFDERQALHSICKKHFRDIYRPPKLPVKQEKILTRENFMQENRMKIKRTIKLPGKRASLQQYAFKGKFFVQADMDDELLEGIKNNLRKKGIETSSQETAFNHDVAQNVKAEIIPHTLPDYEMRLHKTQRPKRIDGFMKFFKDFQGLLMAKDEEIVRKPSNELKLVVSVTDFVRPKEHIVEEALETSVSSFLTIPGDSSVDEEDEHPSKQPDEEEKENQPPEERMSSAIVEQDDDEKPKQSHKVEQIVKKGRWRLLSIKKATYIILRFLHDMTKQRYLPDKKILEDTTSEHSSLSPPPSVKVQVPPILALKSILTEKKSEKISKPSMQYLEECAKNLYMKIRTRQRRLLLDKCKLYGQMFSDKYGIPNNGFDVIKMIDKWRSDEIMHASWEQQDVSSLSTCYSESSQSFITEKDPTMFDQAVLKTKGKKSNHVEVLSLFLLFLNVAKKIMNVRKALQEYKATRDAPLQKRKSKTKRQRAMKKKKKDSKIVSLPNFRKFLEKNCGLYDVNEYIALAQRYCPDYEFYERKKDIKRPPAPTAAGSGEELGVPAQVKETKSVYFKEESVSAGTSVPYTEEEAEKRKEKELRKRLVQDKSYISWKGPPCEEDFSTKTRVYLMKHSTEWAPFPDFSDISIDKKFISSPFFEFPTALAIPRLVSRYYRHLPALKLPDTYILDPPPDSLKWDRSCWMETEKKLPYYEKYDKDFPWISRYFNLFWLSEDKKEFTKEEIQKKMFSSWCGNLFLLGDDSFKFFSKLCEAIEAFEKENKGVKKIYNAADASRSGPQTWEWMKMNKYLENISPIDLLGIHKWSRELNNRYNEAEFKEESSITGLHSFSSSRMGSFMESSVDIVPDRAQEKVDEPKDFPIQDFKSLKEVLVSFIELVKKFKSYRIAPYGENYRPITEYYLKCITEECGFVDTTDEPSDHPNIRLVPARAICYSDKEKQFYYHSNNFIDTLQKKYPQRFLKMPFHVRNEYGTMKHICTFISTRRLSFPELNTWKGCMRTVGNKLECIPLNDGNRPPRMVKSPFSTMQERKGNVFELSVLLTGFLIAAGYDAYCVCGTATYHRAFYGNTDDVSPDESDIEPPSTNRYKQCNMLPPFSSRWYRDSAAYHDPIPYEEMEVCKMNRNKKKIFREHYSTWPKTDQEILAEYNKELVEKPRHKSRFDNPAIPLPCNWKKEETSEEEETAEEKVAMRKLDEIYDKLVAERGMREEEERRKEEEKKKSMRTYIHETPSDPKSQFVEEKMRRERFEMEMKREESKRSKGKSQFMEKQLEELKHFSWLYGPNGPHPEYSEMLRKDRKRLKQVSDLPEINLLQFMEFYDPTKHRLEALTGEKLHYYERDSLRCKRKLKSIDEKLWEMDMNRLERIKLRRAQYKKADESEQKQKKVGSDIVSESLLRITEAKARRGAKYKRKGKPRKPKTATAKEIKVNASVTAVTHRQKLLQSPFIRKLWMDLSSEFPDTHTFKRIKESMGFKPKQLRRHRDPDLKLEDFAQVIKLLEGTYYLKHLNPATLQFIEPILQKVSSHTQNSRNAIESLMKARSKRMHRRKIKKTREKKLLQKKPYIPNRIHCWVLIREGARNIKKPFFIDVFTGVPYPVEDGNYLKISCAWNDKNYYIPRYVATHHNKIREFDFRNNEYWFHLLPLEPMSTVVEKKRKPWWWEIKGHPHVLQHIEMPPYWGRRVRVPALEWDKMFPNTNKKTFYYKRTIIEVYDRDGRPADGLIKRISKFLDMRRTILESVDTKYELRKDRLMWRHFDVNSGFVEERFEEGRPDHLKCYRFLAYLLPGLYTPKEFQFYGKRRDDKLSNLLMSDKYMVAEFKEGRMDHLKRVKYCYSKKKTDQRLFVIDEYSRRVKRICARYRRLSFQFEPWKQYFKEFSEIPIKLEINMNSMFSEYWYWDEKLLAPVKWVAEHLDEESTGFAKSKKINQFLDTEPILYGIGRTLEDTHSQFIKRKERYEKRESDDRIYLMSVARVLEEVVCNTLVQREYEKIMDVLRGADELKRLNINSEKALDTMKTYFEAEREMLQRDFETTKAKKGIGSFFHCDDDTVLENLFNYFINEQYWVRFVIASWDELNKIFRRAMEERKKASPLFQGYSDLLASIVRCHSHGIGMTETTFPPPQKSVLDFELIQAQLPLRAAYRKMVDLRRDMCEVNSEDDKNNHKIACKDIKTSNQLETQDKTCDENIASSSTALESSVTALTRSSQKMKREKQQKCKKKHVDKKKDNLKKCKSGTTKSGTTINSGKECTTLAKDEKNDYTSLDVEKYYLMKKWLLQMVKFLTPKEYHNLLKIKSSPNVGWNKHFVDVFNAFAKEIMSRENQNRTEKEQETLELIDHQHPHRAHLRHHEKVLVALKKLEPNKRLTLEERDEIVNIYNRSRKSGNFEEEDVSDLINIFAKRQNYCQLENQDIQDFIMCFLDHKRAEVIEQPRRNKIVAGKKTKIRRRPLELNFTFENSPSNIKECSFNKSSDGKFKNVISGGQTKIKREAPIDHYKLFVHKYRKVSDSAKGLRNFLSELGYRPRLSLIAESLIDSQQNQPVFSFELFRKKVLSKEKSIKPKPKYGFDGSGDKKLQTCYVDGHYNYNNRFYMYDDIWKDDWIEGNVASGLLPFTTTNFAKTDVGVVDVIDLFSKPSELQFVQRKNEKVFTLQPTLSKEEVKIFDEEAEKEFKELFINDYSYIELCEERILPFLDVPSDTELEIGKSLERTDQQEEEEILKAHSKIPVDKEHLKINSIEPLRKMPLGIAVKSCPHCINVYYQANKERLDMLQYIQTQRDIHTAYCMTRPGKQHLPPNVLEEHRKKIQFFQKYIEYLQNDSSVYNSYGKKIVADECRQYKFFIELLNYKVIYDYFPLNVLYRKYRYETRPWSIYPEEFEFAEAKPYEKMMLSGKVKQIVPREKPETLGEVQTVEHVPFYHSAEPPKPLIRMPSYPELLPLEELLKGDKKKTKHRSLTTTHPEKHFVDIFPEQRKSVPAVVKTKPEEHISLLANVTKDKKKKPYPEIDSKNPIQVELYRDIRPKKAHTKPHAGFKQVEVKGENNRPAHTSVTKRIWK